MKRQISMSMCASSEHYWQQVAQQAQEESRCLLDVLQRLLLAYSVSHSQEVRASIWADARKVIAKATGEQP